MPKRNRCPSSHQEHQAPGKQAGYKKEETSSHEQEKEECGGKRFVGEVDLGCDIGQYEVMASAEVVHAVLQITHITEEVFAHLSSGTYSSWRGERGTTADGGGIEWS